ncbi:hypothetical protein JW758_02875 [Candidatus Peregrinibacteria bacterium]|nr:hypothetical protein [Candidatus Peregrinibacteria bacterium]
MDIEKGDFTETNINKSIAIIEDFIKKLMAEVGSKYGGENANNILKGTILKFISILNLFSIALNLSLKFIAEPKKIFEMANKFTFNEEGISRDYYVIARFNFFIGIFSLFEDAIYNGISPSIFDEDEFNRMKVPQFVKILENEDINNMIKEEYPTIHKNFLKTNTFVPIDRIISGLRKKGIISEDQESFLIGCKVIRNSMHNNGYHKFPTPKKLLMFDEEFVINENEPLDFMSLERILKWGIEIIKIFKEIAFKTDWKNIKDNTI